MKCKVLCFFFALIFGLGFFSLVSAAPLSAASGASLEVSKTLPIPEPTKTPTLTTTAPIASVSSPALATSSASPISSFAPSLPDLNVKGYILLDANSGYVIAEKNADMHLPPASITKLMSLYLVADALKSNRIRPSDQVVISENAWRMGGSKMFIKVGAKVPLSELIDGIVIASGNDATVAVAEYLSGSEPAFVQAMNDAAGRLGMKDTHYADSNGLPAANHYSSARDIASLARNWIEAFPQYYPWFKQQWIVFNGIKQPNRNRLLWRDPSVDGIKTGHTDEAGYCLVASAMRNGMRLISVVLGAPNETARNNDSETLLNYGFRFYETHKLYAANDVLTKARVWMGKGSELSLGLGNDFYATIPDGQYQNLKASIATDKFIKAPIKKGQVLGSVNVALNDTIVKTEPLVALKDVSKAGVVGSLIDRLMLLFYR